ncbi:porin [uncultured Draconibacterium sp.]|uniref:porin n=1 Tax=uncultured Draconibacterium sp. TaxID=1573823 RepID=UPI0029C89DCD|nr:porin [uncultured Draconibacterium sp.]
MLRKLLFILIAAAFLGYNAQGQGCSEPTSDEGVNVFGYLQAQYDYGFAEGDNTNTFGFNRSRIGVMGNIPYDFSYYVLMETSPFKKDGPKAYLLDAFITYNRYSFAKVSLGSFKSPFGQELGTPCHSLYTINRSKFVNELTAPDRDMGLMILGGSDTTLIQYSVALMNGTGLLEKDADKYKDLVGRVRLQPNDWMHVGGSFRFGKAASQDETVTEPDERTRLGAEFEIEKYGFLVQGEYIWSEDKGSYLVGGGCGGDPELVQGSVKREGLSIMALYNLTYNLQPVIKYENYNSDLSLGNNNMEHITTLGINYFFNEWTRLQVNYEYKAEWYGETSNDMVMVQLQVRF